MSARSATGRGGDYQPAENKTCLKRPYQDIRTDLNPILEMLTARGFDVRFSQHSNVNIFEAWNSCTQEDTSALVEIGKLEKLRSSVRSEAQKCERTPTLDKQALSSQVFLIEPVLALSTLV